jgi:hypothetical protein
MSHIYQPVMIKTLLEAGERADKSLIAKRILEYDFSQVEYYGNITNVKVGKVHFTVSRTIQRRVPPGWCEPAARIHFNINTHLFF